jgi:hypothetical protein
MTTKSNKLTRIKISLPVSVVEDLKLEAAFSDQTIGEVIETLLKSSAFKSAYWELQRDADRIREYYSSETPTSLDGADDDIPW